MRGKTQLTPSRCLALDLAIYDLGLTVRTVNMLDAAGIHTVRELLHCCPERRKHCKRGELGRPCDNRHLLDIAMFGEKTLHEVYAALQRVGFERYR